MRAQPNRPLSNSGLPKNVSASDLLTGVPFLDDNPAEYRLDRSYCVVHRALVARDLSVWVGSDMNGFPVLVLQGGLHVIPLEDFPHLAGLVFDEVLGIDLDPSGLSLLHLS